MKRPPHQLAQGASLDWLAEVHGAAQAAIDSLGPAQQMDFTERIRAVLGHCGCGPAKIARRGHVLPEMGSTDWQNAVIYDATRHPHGAGSGVRTRVFAEHVDAYFEDEYADVRTPPTDLIHATCTGYSSPSGAQKLVSKRGWGESTRVTHAYHMGCYAAFPATRLAIGCLSLQEALSANAADRRVDIVHTELCSLHLDPSNHSLEQLVVQSLFADGFIRYSVRGDDCEGLRVLSLAERVLPDTANLMRWTVSDHGMQMSLARDVPERIAGALRVFVTEIFRKADLDPARELRRTVFAVHPGGPKIIEQVAKVLELDAAQVATSRDVLFDCGNMSSATLPHIWKRLIDDKSVVSGTLVLSLAFGPGLTICGGLFRKQ